MRFVVTVVVAALLSGMASAPLPQHGDDAFEGTFSIVARDSSAGELGMAVQSKALATGSRTITIKGGVAAIAHQSQSNPMYGTVGLELLTAGMLPQQALDTMLRSDEGRETRQVAIIDAAGRTAVWTGSEALDWKGHRCGRDFCAQGNILTGPEVVEALARSFESSTGPLAERLVTALERDRPLVATRAACRLRRSSLRSRSPVPRDLAIASSIFASTITGRPSSSCDGCWT
jgi:hypothetical protein